VLPLHVLNHTAHTAKYSNASGARRKEQGSRIRLLGRGRGEKTLQSEPSPYLCLGMAPTELCLIRIRTDSND